MQDALNAINSFVASIGTTVFAPSGTFVLPTHAVTFNEGYTNVLGGHRSDAGLEQRPDLSEQRQGDGRSRLSRSLFHFDPRQASSRMSAASTPISGAEGLAKVARGILSERFTSGGYGVSLINPGAWKTILGISLPGRLSSAPDRSRFMTFCTRPACRNTHQSPCPREPSTYDS